MRGSSTQESGGCGRFINKMSSCFVRCFVWLKIFIVTLANQFHHTSNDLILLLHYPTLLILYLTLYLSYIDVSMYLIRHFYSLQFIKSRINIYVAIKNFLVNFPYFLVMFKCLTKNY